MGDVTYIEQVPSDMPDWAVEAFHSSTFFQTCLDKVTEAESRIAELKQNYNDAGEMLYNQAKTIQKLAEKAPEEWVPVDFGSTDIPKPGTLCIFCDKPNNRYEVVIATSCGHGNRIESGIQLEWSHTHWKPLTPPGDC